MTLEKGVSLNIEYLYDGTLSERHLLFTVVLVARVIREVNDDVDVISDLNVVGGSEPNSKKYVKINYGLLQ